MVEYSHDRRIEKEIQLDISFVLLKLRFYVETNQIYYLCHSEEFEYPQVPDRTR